MIRVVALVISPATICNVRHRDVCSAILSRPSILTSSSHKDSHVKRAIFLIYHIVLNKWKVKPNVSHRSKFSNCPMGFTNIITSTANIVRNQLHVINCLWSVTFLDNFVIKRLYCYTVTLTVIQLDTTEGPRWRHATASSNRQTRELDICFHMVTLHHMLADEMNQCWYVSIANAT